MWNMSTLIDEENESVERERLDTLKKVLEADRMTNNKW